MPPRSRAQFERSRPASCERCGQSFEAPNAGPLPHYCSDKCKYQAKQERIRQQREAQGLPVRPKRIECATCGTDVEVKPVGRLPKYCPDCSPRQQSLRRSEERLRREQKLPSSDSDLSCKRCGKSIRGSGSDDPSTRMKAHIVHFETRHSAGSNRRDKDRYDRAVRLDASPIEFVREVEVFRRDRYVCQMCGKSLILNERPRHPKGPSVDHIEWISFQGGHTYQNTRTAHLACNTREGWSYKKSATARANRSRAAKERYRRQQRAKAREDLMGFILTVVFVIVLLLLLSNC